MADGTGADGTAAGGATELVVSREGAAEASTSGPDVDVQPARVRQARKIAGTAEKRIGNPLLITGRTPNSGGARNIKGYC